jgi:hypothetical protein
MDLRTSNLEDVLRGGNLMPLVEVKEFEHE